MHVMLVDADVVMVNVHHAQRYAVSSILVSILVSFVHTWLIIFSFKSSDLWKKTPLQES